MRRWWSRSGDHHRKGGGLGRKNSEGGISAKVRETLIVNIKKIEEVRDDI